MPDHPAENWYPDPLGRCERRYWDGTRWTEHVESGGIQRIDSKSIPSDGLASHSTVQTAAGWHADPFGRHQYRYWDGSRWTEHASSAGARLADPPVPSPPVPTANPTSRGMHQYDHSGSSFPEPAILTEPVLVVNQNAKVLGSNVEYAVLNENGQRIGAVQEVGRGILRKAMDRSRKSTDTNRRYRLHVVDQSGRLVLAMTRSEKLIKSTMIVSGADGTHIGTIAQETLGMAGGFATVAHAGLSGWSSRLDQAVDGLDKVGHIRFGMATAAGPVGSVSAENLSAWDFRVQDAQGTNIAQITKTWAGWAKERFTRADNYVILVYRPLAEPLRSLVIAAGLAVDISLKEGVQSSGSWSSRKYK